MGNSAEREKLLHTITAQNSGRKVIIPEEVKWGELLLPAGNETAIKNTEGLKVLAICSWTLGFLAFETLKLIEKRLRNKINIVGLVTDDPTDQNAKISKKRRFWRYYDKHQQEEFERGILESALEFGVPCFTGDVKSEYFRNLLKKLNPDLIVVSAFGQLIDQPIIDYPAYGIYNVHPADLLHHFGAGPQPWEDLINRKAKTTRVTLHKVSTTIDSGDIVGQSSPINVRLKNNEFTGNIRMIGEKTLLPVDHMVAELVCRVIMKKKNNETGRIDKIDFESLFTQEFKDKLMLPIDPVKRGKILPLPSDELVFTV